MGLLFYFSDIIDDTAGDLVDLPALWLVSRRDPCGRRWPKCSILDTGCPLQPASAPSPPHKKWCRKHWLLRTYTTFLRLLRLCIMRIRNFEDS